MTKTARQLIEAENNSVWFDIDEVEQLMVDYAQQVAEAVRDEAIKQTGSPLLQERIRNIDINQFLK